MAVLASALQVMAGLDSADTAPATSGEITADDLNPSPLGFALHRENS